MTMNPELTAPEAAELDRIRLEGQLQSAIESRASLIEQRSVANARIADLERELAEAREELARRDEQYQTSPLLRTVWYSWQARDALRADGAKGLIRVARSKPSGGVGRSVTDQDRD